ncbi:MAG: hypothetical protein U1C57_02820 [Candidatus Doudnabacteria bacterium]|nr:hypothetical protein [Candidatus Doudnabacteria bacterium]
MVKFKNFLTLLFQNRYVFPDYGVLPVQPLVIVFPDIDHHGLKNFFISGTWGDAVQILHKKLLKRFFGDKFGFVASLFLVMVISVFLAPATALAASQRLIAQIANNQLAQRKQRIVYRVWPRPGRDFSKSGLATSKKIFGYNRLKTPFVFLAPNFDDPAIQWIF